MEDINLSERKSSTIRPYSLEEIETRFIDRSCELQLLQKLNNAANLDMPLQEILKLVTDGVKDVFNYAACDIYLYEKHTQELVLNCISVDSKALRLAESITGLTARNLRVPIHEGSNFYDVIMNQELYATEDMIRVFEDFTESRTLKLMAAKVARIFGFKAAIRAPLIFNGEVIGVMGVARKSSITSEDAGLLMRFASNVALIIRKAMVEKALKKSYEEMEARVEQRTSELSEVNEKLRSEIAERKHIEEKLRESLSDKDILIKEIHHRVKNNLLVIQSLLNLQSGVITDEKSKLYFKDAQNRVRSMSMIHERLYRSDIYSSLNISEYLLSLVNMLYHNYRLDTSKVSFEVNIPEKDIDVDTMIPCGLIVNELVSNALKYAFPNGRKGKMSIDLLEGRDNEYTLIVKDNGIGLSEKPDLENAKTLGLQIVSALVNQLEGKLELLNNNGLEFRITFKEKAFR